MKQSVIVFILLTLTLILTSTVFAAGVSVRVEQPDSPTSKNNFKLVFVALDVQDRPVSVKCFVKKPGEGSFNQFDTTKSLMAGGNSSSCQVTTNEISPPGTYEFQVTAQAGADSATTSTSVTYDSQGPNPPINYQKEVVGCDSKIKFKTANDGQTVRVEVYRSESQSYNLDSGSKVGEVALGPDQNGELTNHLPDCSKTYYYAIRAFDSTGNASSPVGDAGINVTTTVETKTQIAAIPTNPKKNNSIPSENPQTNPQGTVLGEATIAPTPQTAANNQLPINTNPVGQVQGAKTGGSPLNIIIGIFVISLLALVILRKLLHRA